MSKPTTSQTLTVMIIESTREFTGVEKAFDPNGKTWVDIAVMQWDLPKKPHCHVFLRNDPERVERIFAAQEDWVQDGDPFGALDALICINAPGYKASDVIEILGKIFEIKLLE